MTIAIHQETTSDHTSITDLIDSCFGTDRKSRTVYQFRDGIASYTDLCLTAKDENGTLCGSLRFWPVLLPNGVEVPLFGPLAVQPSLQGKGIGKSLIVEGHKQVAQSNYPAILIIGRPDYYTPFGYSEDVVKNLTLPGPTNPLTFMGLELEEGSLSNLVGNVCPASRS